MLRAIHNSKKRETLVVMEEREDCIMFINNLVSLMNGSFGRPVKLRIKTEG